MELTCPRLCGFWVWGHQSLACGTFWARFYGGGTRNKLCR